jgi:hypothetical protein
MKYVCRCPFESNGRVGIWRCADEQSFILLCDECQALWLKPDEIVVNAAVLSPDAGLLPKTKNRI